MLSQGTEAMLASWFVQQGPFSIPSPNCGMELLRHAKAIDGVAEGFGALNGTENPVVKELQLYSAALRAVAGEILVLEAIPIARLAQLAGVKEDDGKGV